MGNVHICLLDLHAVCEQLLPHCLPQLNEQSGVQQLDRIHVQRTHKASLEHPRHIHYHHIHVLELQVGDTFIEHFRRY